MVRNLVVSEWRRSAIWRDGRRRLRTRRNTRHRAVHARLSKTRAGDRAGQSRSLAVAKCSFSRYHGLNNAQVAEVLGVSPQTVANQLVSALRTLRELLQHRLDDVPASHLRIVRSADQ
jgi:hypothetical protein